MRIAGRKRHASVMVVKIALFLTIVVAGFGQAVHYLWNWLMPELFGMHLITFWQAVGLLGLSWLLFGGWRGFRRPSGRSRKQWKQRMMERMTPEERARLRQGFRSRFDPEHGFQA